MLPTDQYLLHSVLPLLHGSYQKLIMQTREFVQRKKPPETGSIPHVHKQLYTVIKGQQTKYANRYASRFKEHLLQVIKWGWLKD